MKQLQYVFNTMQDIYLRSLPGPRGQGVKKEAKKATMKDDVHALFPTASA